MNPFSKRCSKCKTLKTVIEFHRDKRRKDGLAHWCSSCLLEHNRNWKRRNPDVMKRYYATEDYREYIRNYMAKYRKSPEHVRKIAARRMLYKAVERGVVDKPETCSMSFYSACNGRLEAHHDDYSQPLDVRWFCRKHHEYYHHVEENIGR